MALLPEYTRAAPRDRPPGVLPRESGARHARRPPCERPRYGPTCPRTQSR